MSNKINFDPYWPSMLINRPIRDIQIEFTIET